MKDYKFYTKVSLVFVVVYVCMAVGAFNILINNFTKDLIDRSLDNAQEKTITIKRVFAKISGIDKSFDEELVIQNILEDSQSKSSFVSIINWAGNFVCHPEIFKVGEKPTSNNVFENETIDTDKVFKKFFSLFSRVKYIEEKTPIINLESINNSDLIIASHLNLEEMAFEVSSKRPFYISGLAILGLIVWLFVLWSCRYLSTYFSKRFDAKVEELSLNAKSIADLNDSLEKYQENLNQIKSVQPTPTIEEKEDVDSENSKERILTYVRNELVPIIISSIAYIYVENTITYIVTNEGKRSTTPDSLDKIYGLLDSKVYFKVNRQFIVGISAIEKITKFENSKLKLEVNPFCELDIVIGKNKVSQFKQWLDL